VLAASLIGRRQEMTRRRDEQLAAAAP